MMSLESLHKPWSYRVLVVPPPYRRGYWHCGLCGFRTRLAWRYHQHLQSQRHHEHILGRVGMPWVMLAARRAAFARVVNDALDSMDAKAVRFEFDELANLSQQEGNQ